jgi:diguanylate cyclase (GGDEF)-like protein
MSIKNIFPFLDWLFTYKKSWFKDDFFAGITIGVINIVNSISKKEFSEEDIEIMKMVGETIGEVINNVKMYEFITTDNSTGLLTENYFKKSLELQIMKCRRYGVPISLLLIKIDDYEILQKKFGEHVVTLIVKELSELIKPLIANGICSLFKSEDKIIILTEDDIDALSEKIRMSVIDKEFTTGGTGLKLTLSMGGVSTTDYLSITSEILRKLDEALIFSIKKGGNKITIDKNIEADEKEEIKEKIKEKIKEENNLVEVEKKELDEEQVEIEK